MRERNDQFEYVLSGLLEHTGIDADKAAASIIWHLLRVTRHVETKLDFEVHRRRGWSWSGFRAMANLYVEGTLEPSELAAILNVSRPSITSLINKLETSNLVERQPHPSNRSRTLVSLTREGRLAIEQSAVPHHIGEIKLTSGLTGSEREQLSSLLAKLYLSLGDA